MKEKQIQFGTGSCLSTGKLLILENPGKILVLFAHGAGYDMDTDFISYFHSAIAEAGYPSMKFNFFYTEARKKAPDREELFMDCYRKVMEASGIAVSGPGRQVYGSPNRFLFRKRKLCPGSAFPWLSPSSARKTHRLRDSYLYSIRKPMLFINGTRDPFAREDLLVAVLKRLGKHAEYLPIPNGGHSFEIPKKSGPSTEEMWKLAATTIRQWLNRHFS